MAILRSIQVCPTIRGSQRQQICVAQQFPLPLCAILLTRFSGHRPQRLARQVIGQTACIQIQKSHIANAVWDLFCGR